MSELKTITPTELHALAGTRPVRLIDVRTPAEFARGHARGAENVPARRLDAAAVATSAEPVYLICRGGTRAAEVCARLATEAPAVRAVVVEGGTLAWAAAGLPVERPPDWRKYRRWLHRVGGAGHPLGSARHLCPPGPDRTGGRCWGGRGRLRTVHFPIRRSGRPDGGRLTVTGRATPPRTPGGCPRPGIGHPKPTSRRPGGSGTTPEEGRPQVRQVGDEADERRGDRVAEQRE